MRNWSWDARLQPVPEWSLMPLPLRRRGVVNPPASMRAIRIYVEGNGGGGSLRSPWLDLAVRVRRKGRLDVVEVGSHVGGCLGD